MELASDSGLIEASPVIIVDEDGSGPSSGAPIPLSPSVKRFLIHFVLVPAGCSVKEPLSDAGDGSRVSPITRSETENTPVVATVVPDNIPIVVLGSSTTGEPTPVEEEPSTVATIPVPLALTAPSPVTVPVSVSSVAPSPPSPPPSPTAPVKFEPLSAPSEIDDGPWEVVVRRRKRQYRPELNSEESTPAPECEKEIEIESVRRLRYLYYYYLVTDHLTYLIASYHSRLSPYKWRLEARALTRVLGSWNLLRRCPNAPSNLSTFGHGAPRKPPLRFGPRRRTLGVKKRP